MKYVLIFLIIFSVLYAYEWTPICDEDHSINGFVQNPSGIYPFILACDEGLLLKSGDDWILESYGGLPVWEILPLDNGQFLIIQGAGSYSDGVYIFDENTLQFEVMEWIIFPNFLVYNENQQEYFIGAFDGLYKSTDTENWQENTYFSGMNCQDMIFCENHYAVSVDGNIFGVYYSDDYGYSWNQPVIGCSYICDLHSASNEIFYGIFPGCSNSSGLWSSTDFGTNWQVEFWSDFCSCVIEDMSGNIFVGWNSNGIAKWENNGIVYINNGLPCYDINKLFINPLMSCVHVIALADSGAYLLTNYTEAEPVIPKPEIKLTNFPNPFNPTTEISFNLTTEITENTEIQIFNSKGQKIKQLISDQLSASQNTVTWNGMNSNNKPVSSGVYFYKLMSGNRELAANKMLLLK